MRRESRLWFSAALGRDRSPRRAAVRLGSVALALLLSGACQAADRDGAPAVPTATSRAGEPGVPATAAATSRAGSPSATDSAAGPLASPGAPGSTRSPGPPQSPAAGLPSTLDWQVLADFPVEQAVKVSSVTAWQAGFVAVGYEPGGGEDGQHVRNGVVWSSSDGRNWSRSRPAELSNATLQYVVTLGQQLYLFGLLSICPSLSEDCPDLPDAGVALWRSSDALAWERLPLPSSLQTGLLDGAAVGLERLIAFGGSGQELTPAVWLSADGVGWEERHDLAGLDAIVALGAGPQRMVGFGTRYVTDTDDVEALAAYSEGGGFAPASLPPDTSGVINGVAWGTSGFVAVGFADDPEQGGLSPTALVSADGTSWTPAPPDTLPAETGLLHVLPLSRGYVALGFRPDDALFGRQRAHYSLSADGLRWSAAATLGGEPYRDLTAVASAPAGIVAFSLDFEEEPEEEIELTDSTIQVWFAPATAVP